VAGYNATIPVYVKSIYLLQGTSNTTPVTVRNSGSFDALMSLATKDIEGAWSSITPANATINAGQTSDFTVKFNVPANAVVRNYTGKYSVSADTEIAADYFYLIVLPTEATKSEINATILNYTNTLQELIKRLNVTMFPVTNSTELKLAGEKLDLAASLFSQAKDHISRGDYVKANELVLQAKSLLDAADALIKTVETQQGGRKFENILTVAGIVAGVTLVGLLVYMLLPEPGYSQSKGYTIPEQTGQAGKIKQKLKKAEDLAQEIIEKIKETIEKISGKKGEGYTVS